MGLIRKVISGAAAVATGGASLAVVQFRSDTERGTRQTKLLRRDLAASAARAAVPVGPPVVAEPSLPGRDGADELELIRRLHALKAAGALTEEEFELEKRQLLARASHRG